MLRLVLAIVVLIHVPTLAAAQVEPDSVHLRNRCRLAAQIVERGHPSPHEEWAFRWIGYCGQEGATTLARALRELRASSDTSALRRVTASFATVRHPDLFAASYDVASDHSASEAARAYAFRNLAWIVNPTAGLEDFNPWTDQGASCLGHAFERSVTQLDALPVRNREEIRALALQAFRNASEPLPVRRTARCVLLYGGWGADVRYQQK